MMLCWISSVPPAIDWAGTETSTSATIGSPSGAVSIPRAPATIVCTRAELRATSLRPSLPSDPHDPGPPARAGSAARR